jgi:carboxyl-terminal processing protease
MESAESELLETLEENHLIFRYVTKWVTENPAVESVETFQFTQWDDFIQFLEKMNFDFDTESEELLAKLAEQSSEDGYLSQADVKALEKKVNAAKKKDLNDHKEAVTDLIEKEIASRFFYEKGRVQVGLRNDAEIKKAVELFGDKAKYEKILKG